MKREIKFRAWAKDEEMSYYPYCLKECKNGWDIDWFQHFGDCHIMQYTGLKDKYNDDVYEGDIVAFTDDILKEIVEREVYFDEELLEFGVKYSNQLFDAQFGKDFVIIGNIYEDEK